LQPRCLCCNWQREIYAFGERTIKVMLASAKVKLLALLLFLVPLAALGQGACDSPQCNFTFPPSLQGSVARSIKDKGHDVLNVKDFGAVVDGIADDSTPLQNCVNASRTTGQTCWIPGGHLYIGTTTIDLVPVPLGKDFEAGPQLRGSGVGRQGTTIIYGPMGIVGGGNGIAIRAQSETPCQGGAANAPVGVEIADLSIQYTGVYPQGSAIFLCGANNAYLRNVQIGAYALGTDGTFQNVSLGTGLTCWGCAISWFDDLVIFGTASAPPTLAWIRDGILMLGGGGSNFFRGTEQSQVHNAVHFVGTPPTPAGNPSAFWMNVFVDQHLDTVNNAYKIDNDYPIFITQLLMSRSRETHETPHRVSNLMEIDMTAPGLGGAPGGSLVADITFEQNQAVVLGNAGTSTYQISTPLISRSGPQCSGTNNCIVSVRAIPNTTNATCAPGTTACTATITVNPGGWFSTGQWVTIQGYAGASAGYNGTWLITPPFIDSTHFSYVTNSPSLPNDTTQQVAVLALQPPTGSAVVTNSSGTLAKSTTYGYRVSALNMIGGTAAAAEVTVTTGAGCTGQNCGATLSWNPVIGATAYDIWGRTPSAEVFMVRLPASYTSWNDDGVTVPNTFVGISASDSGSAMTCLQLAAATAANATSTPTATGSCPGSSGLCEGTGPTANIVTVTTTGPHNCVTGSDRNLIISGPVSGAGYNGVWTVASVIDSTHFTYYNPTSGLGAAGDGASVTCSTGGARVYKSQVAMGADTAFPGGMKTLTALTPAGCTQYEPFLNTDCATYNLTFPVQTASWSDASGSGVATITIIPPPPFTRTFYVGSSVNVSNIASSIIPGGYNGTFTITAIPKDPPNTFSYALGSNPGPGSGGSVSLNRCTGFQYFEAGSGTQAAAAQFDSGDYAINVVSNNNNAGTGSSVRILFRNNQIYGWRGALRSYSLDAQGTPLLPFANSLTFIRERNELSFPAQNGLQTWPRRNFSTAQAPLYGAGVGGTFATQYTAPEAPQAMRDIHISNTPTNTHATTGGLVVIDDNLFQTRQRTQLATNGAATLYVPHWQDRCDRCYDLTTPANACTPAGDPSYKGFNWLGYAGFQGAVRVNGTGSDVCECDCR
jgi:hypothetical protein